MQVRRFAHIVSDLLLICCFQLVASSQIAAVSPCAQSGEHPAQPGNELVPVGPACRLVFGNLRKLVLEGGSGPWTLNGYWLAKISDAPFSLSTSGMQYRVQVSFETTVMISSALPAGPRSKSLLDRWASENPALRRVLARQDDIASVKLVRYGLIQPRGRTDLQLQEELVFLWSSNPDDSGKIGDTSLLPPVDFPGRLSDIQYRGIKHPAGALFGKIVLQILYVRDQSRSFLLGGFVIASRPTGEYEFYLVPMDVLRSVIVEEIDAKGEVRFEHRNP